MKNSSRNHKFKNMLAASALFGCLLGISDIMAGATFSQIEAETQWYCSIPQVDVGGNSCRATRCKRSNGQSDGYWVCDYTNTGGGGCPPLKACELGSGS
jgi:hypothetical protein